MVVFKVGDISCGHCAGAITKAVHACDSAAKVDVVIIDKLVSIDSSRSTEELAAAIAEAGFTPELR